MLHAVFSDYISLHSVSKLIDGLPEGAAKKAVLGMRSFPKAVITHMQNMIFIDYLLLRALTCLNPREQKCQDTLQNCKVVAKEMPSIGPEEESWR